MRYIIGFCFLFLGFVGFAQVERTAGIAIGTTVPTHTPSTQGALKYYNRSSGVSYRWTGSAWTVETVDLSGYLQWSDTATLATKHYVDSQGFLTAEVDGSITNEIQDLSISGTTLSLSGDASTVDLSGIGLISSGVAGYMTQFTSATSIDTTGAFWNASNVRLGLNRATPNYSLHVHNPLEAGTWLQMTSNTSGTGSSSGFFFGFNSTASAQIYGMSGMAVDIYPGNAFSTRFASNGRVGIKQNIPTASLHITGEGTTPSTTALLVENSAGTDGFRVLDNGYTITEGIGYTLGYNHVARRYGFGSGAYPGLNYGYISSSANGIFQLVNSAENDFNRLTFGGTTSSYPALKRSTTNLEVKLADDTYGAGLSIGGSLSASAILEAASTTKGFLPPRMTTAQRDAISSPATGLMLFCTDCTATDGSTGVSQTYSSGTWKNHY